MKPSKSTVKLSKRQYQRVSRTKSAGNKRCKLALKRDSVSGSKRSSSSVRAKAQKRPHSEEKSLINDKKRRLNRENPWNKIWKVIDERTRQNGHSNNKVIVTCKEANKPQETDAPKSNNNQQTVNEKNYKEEYIKRLECLEKYGKNFYCPAIKQGSGLRPVYIDGSNVAFSHGQHQKFSVEGLKICIDYFKKRGHDVRAFVPNFRLRKGESTNQPLLHSLVRQKLVITTPTLFIQNQLRSPYDDWYIVQSAAANGGIIVSADNFQDIVNWNPNLRPVVEERRLVPTFVDDMIIFPVDPHGNRKNNLEQFLRF